MTAGDGESDGGSYISGGGDGHGSDYGDDSCDGSNDSSDFASW